MKKRKFNKKTDRPCGNEKNISARNIRRLQRKKERKNESRTNAIS